MTQTLTGQEISRDPSPGFPEGLPRISIIVPVRNEAAFIRGTLRQLLAQNYPPERFEIIVADGQSTDETPRIVRDLQARHPVVRLISNPRRLSSAGRNLGIRAARGDLIVIIDGHCELDSRDYLRNLAEAFERSGADCIGRPQPLDVSGATVVQRAIAQARSSRFGHHPASYIYSSGEQFVRPQSVAVAYRRSVFQTVGGFDEEFDACEDVEFNHRVEQAGLRCFFTPRVGVRYHPRSSLRGLFVQMVRYGRGRVRLARKHPETFSVPGFLPAAFLAGVLAGPALAWLWPWLAFVYGGVMGLYALLLGIACLVVLRNTRDGRLLPWLPLAFVTIHGGAGAGILWECLAWLWRRGCKDTRRNHLVHCGSGHKPKAPARTGGLPR